jgi:hypothetical protein
MIGWSGDTWNKMQSGTGPENFTVYTQDVFKPNRKFLFIQQRMDTAYIQQNMDTALSDTS